MSKDVLAVASVKAMQGVSETAIREAAGVIKEMFRASKSSPLMSILSFLFGLDFYHKLGLIWPNTAQAGREALFTALGLSFDFSRLQNLKLWEQDIPIIGFLFTATKVEYQSILSTTLKVDATGGESIIEKAVGELGGGGEDTTKSDIATLRRLRTLMTTLEKIPEITE